MLGHHFGLSEDRRRGARYLVAAADWARGIYANDDAIRHYEQALRILRDCDVCEAETVEIHERLGDLLAPLGRGSRSARALRDHPARGGGGRRRTCDRRACIARSADCIGMPASASRAWHASKPGSHCSKDASSTSSSPICIRRWDGSRFAAAITRVQSSGPSARSRRRRVPLTRAGGDAEARREAADAVAHALNTLGSALARLDRAEEAVRAHRAQRGRRSIRRIAAGRMPKLRQPRRPLFDAESRAAQSKPA